MPASVGPMVMSQSLLASKYAYVASVTILVWDMLITVTQEYRYVWRVRKTFGTSLFLANRYLPLGTFAMDLLAQFLFNPSINSFHLHIPVITLVANTTSSSCKDYEVASTILDIVSIAVVECVLIMRTHALYQDRRVLYVLHILGVLSIVNMLVCFLIIINRETFAPASTLGMMGCLSGCEEKLCRPLLIWFWMPFLFFETTIFVLTAWKSYSSLTVTQRQSSTQLIEVMFRDGLIYYLVIMAASLVNFWIWILHPYASYLAVGLLKSLQVTICSRLLLNIRGILKPESFTHSATRGIFAMDTDELYDTKISDELADTRRLSGWTGGCMNGSPYHFEQFDSHMSRGSQVTKSK